MKFRRCEDSGEHRIEVTIGRDGDGVAARADMRPTGGAEEYWDIDGAPPKETLIRAQKEARSRGLPLCVRLDGVDWDAAWDEAFDIGQAAPGKAAQR